MKQVHAPISSPVPTLTYLASQANDVDLPRDHMIDQIRVRLHGQPNWSGAPTVVQDNPLTLFDWIEIQGPGNTTIKRVNPVLAWVSHPSITTAASSPMRSVETF